MKKSTVQRQRLLEALQQAQHPMACELYNMVRHHLPHIGLSTVYRNLDIMVAEGLILKLELGGSQQRFDAFTEPHYHIRCVHCNTLEDIAVDFMQEHSQAAIEKTVYHVHRHHLEFQGFCPKCQILKAGLNMKKIPEPMLRLTIQRQIILEELRKAKHPTACELYDMVRRRLPRIGLGTVYRNLDTMTEQGLIVKLEIGGAQKRFDAVTVSHYHIRCACCNKVEDVDVDVIQDLVQMATEKTAYEITGHHVEFTGLCPKCQISKPELIPQNLSKNSSC